MFVFFKVELDNSGSSKFAQVYGQRGGEFHPPILYGNSLLECSEGNELALGGCSPASYGSCLHFECAYVAGQG